MHSCLKLLSILRMNKHGTPEPDVFSPTGLKVASLTVQAPVCARLHMTTHPRIRHKTIDSCTMCSMPDPHVHHMHIHIPSLTLKCQQACHIFLTAWQDRRGCAPVWDGLCASDVSTLFSLTVKLTEISPPQSQAYSIGVNAAGSFRIQQVDTRFASTDIVPGSVACGILWFVDILSSARATDGLQEGQRPALEITPNGGEIVLRSVRWPGPNECSLMTQAVRVR